MTDMTKADIVKNLRMAKEAAQRNDWVRAQDLLTVAQTGMHPRVLKQHREAVQAVRPHCPVHHTLLRADGWCVFGNHRPGEG